jgi:lipoyl(octanoyl) transferase
MMHVLDAGVMAYRAAWDAQLALHERVVAGELAAGALMLVEHLPVITIGRRPGAGEHLLASAEALAARGVEVVETDRGGDITFHGPGQLVAYPIVPLNRYNFNLHSYMRFLEEVVIRTLAGFGVEAVRDEGDKPATGVWVDEMQNKKRKTQNVEDEAGGNVGEAGRLAKICALGIKLRRWVTLHGIALNVTTDLSYYELINACGLSRPVTSMQRLLGERTPSIERVKQALAASLQAALP